MSSGAHGLSGTIGQRGRVLLARLAAKAIALFALLMTSPRVIWAGVEPVPAQRVYFANHTSNGDFVLIWACLPAVMRARTRPVAALDYWLRSPIRAFLGRDVFNAVLIDRRPEMREREPVAQMINALDQGSSLIVFPEGGRNESDAPLLPFKTGIWHIARQRRDTDFVPVWISNLNSVMPKGELVPLPLLCRLIFGAPLRVRADESKEDFLARARSDLLALADEVPS